MPGPFTFPVAQATPFESERNPQYNGNPGPSGIISENVQEAIEEVKATAPGTSSRYAATSGFEGTATNGRWLEFQTNVASNVSGHVISEAAILKSMSVAVQNAATCTFTIYKNGVILESLSLISQRKNIKIELTHSLDPLDELSVEVTSGFCAKPTFNLFIKVKI